MAETLKASKRACAEAYPSGVAEGVVFVWLDATPEVGFSVGEGEGLSERCVRGALSVRGDLCYHTGSDPACLEFSEQAH